MTAPRTEKIDLPCDRPAVLQIDSHNTQCVICGGRTVPQFSKESLGVNVNYYRCLSCGHLTASDISGLAHYAPSAYFANIDTGWRGRNTRILELIRLLTRLPGIDVRSGSTVLDYGCGIGTLVKSLQQVGFDAYGFEPFQESTEAPGRVVRDWGDVEKLSKQAQLVSLIEVLEHIRNPDDVLRQVSAYLHEGGYLLVSTEPYIRQKHSNDWYYLNPAAGHVSIFTNESLRRLTQRHGFVPVLRLTGSLWLFRLAKENKWFESGYFGLSEMRVKLGLRVR